MWKKTTKGTTRAATQAYPSPPPSRHPLFSGSNTKTLLFSKCLPAPWLRVINKVFIYRVRLSRIKIQSSSKTEVPGTGSCWDFTSECGRRVQRSDDTPGLGTLSAPVPWTRVRTHPGRTLTYPGSPAAPGARGFGAANTARLPDLSLSSAQAIRFDSELSPGHSYRLHCLRSDGALPPPSPPTNQRFQHPDTDVA